MKCFKREGDDAMTGDTDKYLAPQDLRELGDDSLPQEGYMGFSIGARSQSPKVSSDRSNTLNRSSFTRDSMMIEEILAPGKEMHLAVAKDLDNDSLRRYSWTADALDNVNLVSSPIHSGFLVSFMVDARGGSMRGSRHNGMRIIIPPRKCTAPTRITCRLVKRHKLASPPPMVEGEGLASRLVEVGPAGAQFLGPVIVEIPHFGSLRGRERELILLRSENGESWKEHQYDCKTEELNHLLNGMDEELDTTEEMERKRICRIITRDFPQYFAVVSRIRQETNQMGPEGGTLCSWSVPLVQASFPEGALTKKIKVGLQAQPVPDDTVKKFLGNRATFSPIVTVEPRRRKFHKPITMTIPIPPLSGEGLSNGYKGDCTPCLRLLCSITGGTSPAQWEDITGTTPLTFINDCVSFTTNVSARFWLADCHQIPETVGLATQLYRELICVPYMAKFVVFAKMNDPVESQLRCFCMTDDKVDKTLEQQENFEEVARSKDIEVLEGRPIYVDCYGNLAPLSKGSQQLVLNFYAFKENRLPFCVKVRDNSQEPCGRLTFLKECKSKGLPQTAVCNLNITLPALKKETESDPEDETEKPERRHTFASLALRKRYSYLAEPALSPQSPCERTDLRMAIVADHLGLSWTELARELDFSVDEINHIRVENPNSLTAQSFMLLKRWVHRDCKNATTDALTAVLTKINRLDIVTLLEGPIFDYGNISGTRCFADDNAVFLDQSDGNQSIDLELQTPSTLNYQPPTPLRSDDFFGQYDAFSVDPPGRDSPTRPSDLSLTHTTSAPSGSDPPAVALATAAPPSAVPEEWSGGLEEGGGPPRGPEAAVSHAGPDNERPAFTGSEAPGKSAESSRRETEESRGTRLEREDRDRGAAPRPAPGADAGTERKEEEDEEEEEEMTQERLQSLLEDIKLEGGSEDEEMTEERVKDILSQVRPAEKDVCSVSGWCSDTSPAAAAQGHDTEAQQPRDGSPGSADKAKVRTDRRNGGHGDSTGKGSEDGSSTVGPSRGPQDRGQPQHTDQGGDRAMQSSSDEETTVTTKVYHRRVILKGELARNVPGESVTEEQFTDEDGNLITRKVIRKVVRRVVASEERREGVGDGGGDAAGGAGVDGGVATGGASGASQAGAKGRKRGKRSRQSPKSDRPREEQTKEGPTGSGGQRAHRGKNTEGGEGVRGKQGKKQKGQS